MNKSRTYTSRESAVWLLERLGRPVNKRTVRNKTRRVQEACKLYLDRKPGYLFHGIVCRRLANQRLLIEHIELERYHQRFWGSTVG